MAPTCTTCRGGCPCTLTDPGCAHYGCAGRAASNACPGTAYEALREAALSRRGLPPVPVLRGTVAGVLTALRPAS